MPSLQAKPEGLLEAVQTWHFLQCLNFDTNIAMPHYAGMRLLCHVTCIGYKTNAEHMLQTDITAAISSTT